LTAAPAFDTVPSGHDALHVGAIRFVVVIVRCILAFVIIVFLEGVLCIFPLLVHVKIQTFGPQINTSAIHNMVIEPQIRARSSTHRP
jgi:hypothetical protein